MMWWSHDCFQQSWPLWKRSPTPAAKDSLISRNRGQLGHNYTGHQDLLHCAAGERPSETDYILSLFQSSSWVAIENQTSFEDLLARNHFIHHLETAYLNHAVHRTISEVWQGFITLFLQTGMCAVNADNNRNSPPWLLASYPEGKPVPTDQENSDLAGERREREVVSSRNHSTGTKCLLIRTSLYTEATTPWISAPKARVGALSSDGSSDRVCIPCGDGTKKEQKEGLSTSRLLRWRVTKEAIHQHMAHF